MVLDEAGWFERAPIEIHASDASPAALARARAGRYRERSFRALPAHAAGAVFPRRRRRLASSTPALQRA